MVYHFEAQKFLHVCIPQHAEGRKKGRERAQSKVEKTKDTGKAVWEGVHREDLIEKGGAKERKRKLVEEEKRHGRTLILFEITLVHRSETPHETRHLNNY